MSLSLARLLPGHHLPPELAGREIAGLTLDSRRVRPGDAFVAVPGISVDGRDYIEDAIRAGAGAVLAEENESGVQMHGGIPVIAMPELSRNLGHLAARFHGNPGANMQVLGVTGTNGKSSTAWFLRDALEADGVSCALIGTLGLFHGGSHRETVHTTPDALALHAALAEFRDAGARAVVMEVSSHALDQDRLQAVPMTVAVFTNLTHEHLDYHQDMESYYRAKARLFHRPGLELAVLNLDDDAGRRLAGELSPGLPCLGYSGTDRPDADVVASGFRATPQGMEASVHAGKQTLSLRLPLYGSFNLNNVLAVAAVLHGLGRDARAMARALNAITPVPGRMEPVPASAHAPRVLVDYAHTPDALEHALQAARAHFRGALWCVVGCGGERDRDKRPLMAAVAERGADRVVLTSDNPRGEPPEGILEEMKKGLARPEQAVVCVDRRQAVEKAVRDAAPEDVVLIAGKGHERWQEVAGTRHPMDDRELARTALGQREGCA